MNEKLSLTELQLFIRDSLYSALPGLYWVTAEIADIKENYAGHCYLELVEKHPDEINVRAKVKGIIWNNRLRFIKPMFESMTGESLKTGLKILAHIKIEYHEIYGLSLIINDIDPAFTLGEMALKRQQIIRKLEDEGVITMNKELDFPLLPQRIAVISSGSAAGYSDFIKHLYGNSYGYKFKTALFESVMQGPETEAGIITAFDLISEHLSFFDVVVIVRGGGSQSDLSWFDNYKIAYHITQFPLPVITGIGHEKDLSVTDIVAFRCEKTPTASADFLIGCMVRAEDHLLQMGSAISSITMEIIGKYNEELTTGRLRLIPLARISVSSERENLSGLIIGLLGKGKDYLNNEKSYSAGQMSRLRSATRASLSSSRILLENFHSQIGLLNPLNVLKRGYTITSLNGKIVTSAVQLINGDQLDTEFADGRVSSIVTGKRTTKRKNKQ
jgi:exodeoxyribonuclease VII large subunit